MLPFDRNIVSQDTGYWCGPATAQNILASLGVRADESVLAREMGTTQDGTSNVGKITDALKRRLPDARYTTVMIPNDPPTQAQKDLFWWNLVQSIDNGKPVAMNWVAPPGNYPIGVKGSPNPRYGGGTIYHYTGGFGWSDEGRNGKRSVYVVDSGFWPNAYWVDFDQCALLIANNDRWKGYSYANLPLLVPPGPGIVLPPGVTVVDQAPPPVVEPTPPSPGPVAPAPVRIKLADPATLVRISSNSYRPRGLPMPRWIVIHTSESNSRALDLAKYCERAEVSYNRIVDDRDLITTVADGDAPWAAMNANKYGLHVCASSSFASWSRDKWLDPEIGADGIDEADQLHNIARVVAFWVSQYDIPNIYIGGKATPPWGADGICGHRDLGAWGGGHSDPGLNFPWNELTRQVTELITGDEQPPLVQLPPVVVPGTSPDKYADWMIWRGKPSGNDPDRVERVQRRLKTAYASYGGGLAIDRDYSWSDEMVVREFQKRSRLVVDGIVGPNTAAALKP